MNETIQKLKETEGQLRYVEDVLARQTLESWEQKEYQSLKVDYEQRIMELRTALNTKN